MHRHYFLKEAALFHFVFYLCRPGIKRYGLYKNKKELKRLKRRAKNDYQKILASWPQNGGKENVMRHNAPLAMPFIALYRAGGFSAADFRTLLREAVSTPWFIKLSTQKNFDLKRYYKKLKRGALWSQEHAGEYPKTFTYHMTASPYEGDQDRVGWTITRCELLELFAQEGVLDILGAFCELDYLFLERRGQTKLRRCHTLAEGHSACDFLAYKESNEQSQKRH